MAPGAVITGKLIPLAGGAPVPAEDSPPAAERDAAVATVKSRA
jgi:hypothetical protein